MKQQVWTQSNGTLYNSSNSQKQCFSKQQDISILSMVQLRWAMSFVKCFGKPTHTKIKPGVKEDEEGINKKLTDMALFTITCRVKLIGAKWGFVTFRFLVWGVVFTENAAGSGGRQTDKRICHTYCWNKVVNMRCRQEYTTTINYNLVVGPFGGLPQHFCSITIWRDCEDGRNYISGMQPIGKLDNGEGGSSLQRESSDGPRGGAPRLGSCMNLRRVCMAASAYTGPNSERPLFCSQWKSVMGRPQKRDPFVPHSVHMCTRGGVAVYLVQTLKSWLWSTAVNLARFPPLKVCVPTTAVWITLARLSLFNELNTKKKKKKNIKKVLPVSFLGKPAK